MQRKQQGIKAAIFLVLLVGIAVCIIGIVEIARFADSDKTNVYVVNSSYSTALAWFYHGSIYEGVALFFIGFGGIVIGIIGAAGAAMTLSGGDSEAGSSHHARISSATLLRRPHALSTGYAGSSHAPVRCAASTECSHVSLRCATAAEQTYAFLRCTTAAEQADASLRRATSTGTSDASLRCATAARQTHAPQRHAASTGASDAPVRCAAPARQTRCA